LKVASPFNVDVSVMTVQLANRLLQLVWGRNKTDRNARKSESKETLVNATLHLILRQVPESDYPAFEIPVYNSFLCIAQHSAVNIFLCNEVRKIKQSFNLEKWTLGRINPHSFNNILSRFSGTRKSNKNLLLTITVHQLM